MNKDYLKEIIHLRHELHRFPELSLCESDTKQRLMQFIQNHTDLQVTDMGRWFYCTKLPDASDNPAVLTDGIAFRADMDALPIPETIDLPYASEHSGVSHKCGHDGHSAALAGLALELNDRSVNRPVYLIFQHAEEIGQGGEECAKLLEEKNISEVYAFHNLSGYPEGSVVVRKGLTQPASKGLTIHFQGKTSHASNPEEGRNPSFAIANLILYIQELLSRPAQGMLLCTIVHISVGSRDFGVSAGEGELSCTLRAEQEEEMNYLEKNLRSKAHELAKKYELAVSFSEADPFPETRNDDSCLQRIVSHAQTLGMPVIFMDDLWRASEDFGWYLKKCPGAIFYLGNGTDYAPLHTTGYDFNDKNLERAVDLFLSLI